MIIEKFSSFRDILTWILALGIIGIAIAFIYAVWAKPPKF